MNVCLVTGGAGFIGSNFIQYMFEKYEDEISIINVDSLTYAGNLENLKFIENRPNYKFIKADIRDEIAMTNIFNEYEINNVINFAAESHVDRSISDPKVFLETNVLGTANLLECAKTAWQLNDGSFPLGKKFVHISTDEVYGSLGDEGLFTEDTNLDPHSPYSASKASSDLFVKAYADTYGMPINITRCSNNYGPYQFPEKLIPLMICNVISGKGLPVYGKGTNVRDWLFVRDHAVAVDLVRVKGTLGEVYNIGGNNEKQNIEIVKIIIDSIKEYLPENNPIKKNISYDLIKYVEDRKGHDLRYAIDASKIKSELGWEPSVGFDEGISMTIKWYLNNLDWVNNITNGSYKEYYEKIYK